MLHLSDVSTTNKQAEKVGELLNRSRAAIDCTSSLSSAVTDRTSIVLDALPMALRMRERHTWSPPELALLHDLRQSGFGGYKRQAPL